MAKIVLDVQEKDLGTVITVLNSLKEGLISKMEVNSQGSESKQKATRYQPKTQRVIYEQEQSELQKMGKYIDPKEFKRRLHQK